MLLQAGHERLRAVALAQDFLQHRPRHRPQVDVRIERARQTFGVEQGLLQQDQLRLQGQLVFLRGPEQFGHHLGDRELRERAGEIRFADRTHGRLQFIQTQRCRHPAGLHVQACDLAVILVEDRHEIFGEVILVLLAELADDAEIQCNESARSRSIGIDPDVAGMGVGMEIIVAEHLLVEDAHRFCRQRLAVDAALVEFGNGVGGNAMHTLHDQDFFAGQRPDHFRHRQIRTVLPEPAHQTGVGGFALQIAFGQQCTFQFADHIMRTDFVGMRMQAAESIGQQTHQRDIGPDAGFDVGTQHFHNDLAAVLQPCRMHLGNRGRSQRLVIEALEHCRQWLAETGFNQSPCLCRRKGLHLITQTGQLIGDVGGKQIAARGQHLTELDEQRAEFLQRHTQTGAARQGTIGSRGRNEYFGNTQQGRSPRFRQPFIQAVTRCGADDGNGAQQRFHFIRPASCSARACRRSARWRRRSTSPWKSASSALPTTTRASSVAYSAPERAKPAAPIRAWRNPSRRILAACGPSTGPKAVTNGASQSGS